jgi:hypothetical protein
MLCEAPPVPPPEPELPPEVVPPELGDENVGAPEDVVELDGPPIVGGLKVGAGADADAVDLVGVVVDGGTEGLLEPPPLPPPVLPPPVLPPAEQVSLPTEQVEPSGQHPPKESLQQL